MTVDIATWERQAADLWQALDTYSEEEFVARMTELAAQLPPDHPIALFELGGAYDSTGDPARAVDLYRRALAGGLDTSRHRQATIQLASSLRNLGQPEESVALLRAERERTSDELDDAVAAFLALALLDADRGREAVSVALTALGGHMTRYRRSLTAYAADLT